MGQNRQITFKAFLNESLPGFFKNIDKKDEEYFDVPTVFDWYLRFQFEMVGGEWMRTAWDIWKKAYPEKHPATFLHHIVETDRIYDSVRFIIDEINTSVVQNGKISVNTIDLSEYETVVKTVGPPNIHYAEALYLDDSKFDVLPDTLPTSVRRLYLKKCPNLKSIRGIHKHFNELASVKITLPSFKEGFTDLLRIPGFRELDCSSLSDPDTDPYYQTEEIINGIAAQRGMSPSEKAKQAAIQLFDRELEEYV